MRLFVLNPLSSGVGVLQTQFVSDVRWSQCRFVGGGSRSFVAKSVRVSQQQHPLPRRGGVAG